MKKNSAEKSIQIISGIAACACAALWSLKPASPRDRLLVYVLLGVSAALAAARLILALRSSAYDAPEEDGSRTVSLPGVVAFLGELLALAGRHALLIILINRFDEFFFVLYREYDKGMAAAHRVVLDLALAELIVLVVTRLIYTVFLRRDPSIGSSMGNGLTGSSTGAPGTGRQPRDLWLRCSGAGEDFAFISVYSRYIAGVFYLSFGYIFFVRFLQNTMIAKINGDSSLSVQMYRQVTLICFLIAVWALAVSKRLLFMLLEIALLAAGFLHYRQGGQKHIIFALMVLVVAAAGKRARVILWISVISGFAAFSTGYVLMRLGIIEEYVAHTVTAEGVRNRYAFGIISPTDCAAHLFFLIAAWCLVHRPKKGWRAYLAYLPMLFFFYIAWHYCYARISSICILMVIVMTFFRQLGYNVTGKSDLLTGGHTKRSGGRTAPADRAADGSGGYTLPAGLRAIGYIVGGLIASVWAVFFSWCLYMMRQESVGTVWIPFRSLVTRVMNLTSLESRIEVSQATYRTQPVTLLGTVIKEKGYGGGAGATPEEYNFMDISYVKILFNAGIILTVAVLGILIALSVRSLVEKWYLLLLVLAVVALDCLFEHHIYEFYYNVFPLLLFAAWDDPCCPKELHSGG